MVSKLVPMVSSSHGSKTGSYGFKTGSHGFETGSSGFKTGSYGVKISLHGSSVVQNRILWFKISLYDFKSVPTVL